MKNAIKILVAVLVISAFAMTAFATAAPSPMQDGAPAVVTEGVVASAVDADSAAYAALEELGSVDAIDPSLAGAEVAVVFELTADEATEAALAAGETVEVSVEFEVEEGQTVSVLFFDGETWTLLPAECVSYENGVLTITLSAMGVFAIVVG